MQGRIAGGVKGITLGGDDEVIFATQHFNVGEIVLVTTAACFKRVISSLFDVHGRGSKGMMIADIKGKADILFADYVMVPYKLAIISEDKSVKEVDTDDISIENRVSKGKPQTGITSISAVYPMKYKSDYEDGKIQLKF